MKEIGGYFQLELSEREEYHKNAIKLNSARNGLKYILKAQLPDIVYLPAYICDSVIEPFVELGVGYKFYNIDSEFEIIGDIVLEKNEKILVVNYFALKSMYIKEISKKYGNKLIIDNTQAFFDIPIKGIDTIYSPRKFFGVSDGGYLYTDVILKKRLKKHINGHYQHLIGRINYGASAFYSKYIISEESLKNKSIQLMSCFTKKVLCSIDYKNIAKRRKDNFLYLHKQLRDLNLLNIQNDLNFVPFVYPFMTDDEKLRQKLIENKIYVAKYWNDALQRVFNDSIEKQFVNNIISLPIDHRYNVNDMKRIVKIIMQSRRAKIQFTQNGSGDI